MADDYEQFIINEVEYYKKSQTLLSEEMELIKKYKQDLQEIINNKNVDLETETETSAHLEFTDAEKTELKNYPIGSIWIQLSTDQFALRRSIARKIYYKYKLTSEFQDKSDDVKAVFEQYPPWKLYQNNNLNPIRVFGVCEYKDNTFGLHVVSGHFNWINNVVGGFPIEDANDVLIEIEDWTNSSVTTHMIIQSCEGGPKIFYDPCGFMLIE